MQEKMEDVKVVADQLEKMQLAVPYSEMLKDVKLSYADPARLVGLMYEGTNAAIEGASAYNSTLWNMGVPLRGRMVTLEEVIINLREYIEGQVKFCPKCDTTKMGNLENECPDCGAQLIAVPPHTAPLPSN